MSRLRRRKLNSMQPVCPALCLHCDLLLSSGSLLPAHSPDHHRPSQRAMTMSGSLLLGYVGSGLSPSTFGGRFTSPAHDPRLIAMLALPPAVPKWTSGTPLIQLTGALLRSSDACGVSPRGLNGLTAACACLEQPGCNRVTPFVPS